MSHASPNRLAELCDSLFGDPAHYGTTSANLMRHDPYALPQVSSVETTKSSTQQASVNVLQTVATLLGHLQSNSDVRPAPNPPPKPIASAAVPSPSASTSLGAISHATNSTSTSDEAKHLCSQCRKYLPEHQFPIRSSTLTPYLVCKSHEWYWSEEKKLAYWAPEKISTLTEITGTISKTISSKEGLDRNLIWILDDESRESYSDQIVKQISGTGDWTVKKISARKSRSKKAQENEILNFQLTPTTTSQQNGDERVRLILTHHAKLNRWVIELKPDLGRQAGLWSTLTKEQLREEKLNKEEKQVKVKLVKEKKKRGRPRKGETRLDLELEQALRDEIHQEEEEEIESETSQEENEPKTAAIDLNKLKLNPSESSQHFQALAIFQAINASLEANAAAQREQLKRKFPPESSSASPAATAAAAAPKRVRRAQLDLVRPLDPRHQAQLGRTMQPMTLTELLNSPLMDPPLIPLPKRQPRKPSRLGQSSDAVQDDDDDDDDEGSSSDTDPSSPWLRDDQEVEQELDNEEFSSSEDSDYEETRGDWLEGFVKGELMSKGGGDLTRTLQSEVDELEDE